MRGGRGLLLLRPAGVAESNRGTISHRHSARELAVAHTRADRPTAASARHSVRQRRSRSRAHTNHTCLNSRAQNEEMQRQRAGGRTGEQGLHKVTTRANEGESEWVRGREGGRAKREEGRRPSSSSSSPCRSAGRSAACCPSPARGERREGRAGEMDGWIITG